MPAVDLLTEAASPIINVLLVGQKDEHGNSETCTLHSRFVIHNETGAPVRLGLVDRRAMSGVASPGGIPPSSPPSLPSSSSAIIRDISIPAGARVPVPLADDQCSVVIAPPPNGRQRLQHQHPLYPRTTSTAGSSASFAAEVDDETTDETDEATNLDTSLAALRVLTGRGVASWSPGDWRRLRGAPSGVAQGPAGLSSLPATTCAHRLSPGHLTAGC